MPYHGAYKGGHYFGGGYFGPTAARVLPEGRIRRALIAALKADAGVAAVVGARVFPVYVPEKHPLPALAVRLMTDIPGKTIGGHDGTSAATFRLSCVTKDLADGEEASEAIRLALDAFKGSWASPGAKDVDIFKVDLIEDADELVDATDGAGRPYLVTRSDYRILYRKLKAPNTSV